MKLLLDTNILIPLEPTSATNVEPNTADATRLVNAASRVRAQLYVHPIQHKDLSSDSDPQRKELRSILVGKYLELIDPPRVSEALKAAIGIATPGTNDFIDNQLLAAIAGNAVNYLVTEDRGLLRKAIRAGLGDRVLPLKEILQVLESLYEKPTSPPPAVKSPQAYSLDLNDPIWNSFRDDYKDFDGWLRKVQSEHRKCWVIEGDAGYAAIAIVKPEPGFGLLPGNVFKLCSFKVSSDHSGLKYGELLLKTIFAYARENSLDWLFVTVFEKQVPLIELFKSFGFEEMPHKSGLGELVFAKPMHPAASGEQRTGLDYNIRFGPAHIDLDQKIYAIPIKPKFHRVLFPELEDQPPLIPGEHPFGNSLRKAYLSRSPIAPLPAGSVIAFYRSHDLSAITCIGVVEKAIRSRDPDEIAAFVGTRTVYTYEEIVDMCASGEVLAVLFRQAMPMTPPARLEELKARGVLQAPPQSITQLKEDARTWLKLRLQP